MTESRKLSCFVLSPIGDDKSVDRAAADQVIKHLIRKALGDTYEVKRGDDDANPGAITPSIITAILEADLIVADLSGLNPNVFYELAIAHGYARPTVHIQKQGDKIPFDVKDMRVVRYNLADPDELEGAQKNLATSAEFARNSPEKVETPLTSSARFSRLSESTDPVAESNLRVMEAIERLGRDVRLAIHGTSPVPDLPPTDASALRTIVSRALRRGALVEADFASVITSSTSGTFDRWVTEQVEGMTHADEHWALSDLLFDDEMRARARLLPDQENDGF